MASSRQTQIAAFSVGRFLDFLEVLKDGDTSSFFIFCGRKEK
jgi:hypothetical protein